ncbi:putative toxin-antitoxin system toxin component, PIN family [Candidatus Gottesmanbacteria bacterium]|nr:putative toxin-antitoxin system toxin component, PIN family [Candidatus Gottesmanbacteria bacterium]
MLKVIIDTVVFVRSLINPHSRWGHIVFTHNKLYQLFISESIVSEIFEVLKRPELTTKFHTMTKKDFRTVADILGQASAVDIPKIPSVSRDPKDNKFLATAKAAQADYLITEDRDLLDLESFENVKIITALDFLRILEKKK